MKNLLIISAILICFSCKKKQVKTEGIVLSNEAFVSSNDSLNIEAKLLKDAVLAGGKLFRVDSFPSNYINPRPVDIWLPENYSKDKKYAVLYMHDGQNLFDATTTWNNQEWMVDEVATKLMNNGTTKDFIVVGIHSDSYYRWQDLFPQKALDEAEMNLKVTLIAAAIERNSDPDMRGDRYLKFLIEEVKPFIDKSFATLTDADNTFVAGSSMGGLMSMYAVCEYPNVFSGAACISTHWSGSSPKKNNPYPIAIFEYIEKNIPNPKTHKLYFDYGTKTLDKHYPQYAPRVDSIFRGSGYSEINFKNLKFEGENHSEASWQKRLDIPFIFLLGNQNN